MESRNPFASPSAASNIPATSAVPVQGAWRSGSLLVVTPNVTLPDRCVKCGAPCDGYFMRRKLSWHSPLAYLGLLGGVLPYIIIALILTKRMDVRVGVCRSHVNKRRIAMLLATLGFLAGIVVVALGTDSKEFSGLWFLAGTATIIASLILGLLLSRIVWPKRIEYQTAWVSGACDEYLATFPELSG